ncbi:MAG: tellurite resistance/C4-dicarboxylate transporter family protein [Microbacterium sp.]
MQASTTSGTSPLRHAVAFLPPGYFALVMGTGIVSIGLHDAGFVLVSGILMWIAGISYILLWVLYAWRALRFRREVIADLRDPQIAFAFFTIVAGTDVLGVRLAQQGLTGLSTGLFLLAAVLWFVFGYVLPWQVLMTRDGAPILARTDGTWFIWAVASQSLAVGMSQLQPSVGAEGARWVGLLAVLAWSVGVILYAAIGMLVLLRVVRFGITPQQFDPAYWVAMGALAIAVVAGSGIVGMERTPIIDAVRPLIAATVVVFWAFCAWLIPLLIGGGFWRHVLHRVPLRYVPTLWSMVFPMGMFAVASISMGRADRLPMIERIGHVALVVAVVVWAIVFAGMLHSVGRVLWRTLRPRS